jgi:hypothetical protein
MHKKMNKNMKVGAAVFSLALGGGLLAGSVIGSPGTTSAATNTAVTATVDSTASGTATDPAAPDPNAPVAPGAGETPLTGDTATTVTAAAQAAVPDGTIDRVETDSDGVYEAHMTKADGSHVTVQIGSDFTVTAILDQPQGGPHGAGAGETPLTGDTATQVTAAAQAALPDGTIDRVETDSDGMYEAHVTKADGTHVIVQIGSDYSVTAIVDQPQGGPGGHPGGPGQVPPADAPTSDQGSATTVAG